MDVAFDISGELPIAKNQVRIRDLFAGIFYHVPVAIFGVDLYGKILFWNNAAESCFGWSAEDVVGRFNPLIARKMRNDYLDLVERVMLGERFSGENIARLCKDGSTRDVTVDMIPLHDDHGHSCVLSILAAQAEIEPLQTMQRQLHQQLNEVTGDLGQLTSSLSHDLRSPLRTISGFASLLSLSRHELSEQHQECLDQIVAATSTVNTMIDRLLEYVCIESRGTPFAQVRCDDVVRNAIASVNADNADQPARVDFAALPEVVADKAQLLKVFIALLQNVQQHAGSGAEVSVTAQENPGSWEFTVADNGPGIAVAEQDRILKMFIRGSNADPASVGAGLGLCQRIIQRHGGQIRIESTEGGGTAVSFTLGKDIE